MEIQTKRIFLAIEVSSDWKEAIHKFVEANTELNYRWIPEQNWHFTVLFIGDFPVGKLSSIYPLLEKCFSEIPAFKIEFDSLTYFPKNRPRMIWAKGKQNTEFAALEKAACSTLKHFCEDAYMDFNAKRSKQSIPHITLSRLKFARKPFPDLEIPALKIMPAEVKEIVLFESVLKSTGSEYTKLASFTLKNR